MKRTTGTAGADLASSDDRISRAFGDDQSKETCGGAGWQLRDRGYDIRRAALSAAQKNDCADFDGSRRLACRDVGPLNPSRVSEAASRGGERLIVH